MIAMSLFLITIKYFINWSICPAEVRRKLVFIHNGLQVSFVSVKVSSQEMELFPASFMNKWTYHVIEELDCEPGVHDDLLLHHSDEDLWSCLDQSLADVLVEVLVSHAFHVVEHYDLIVFRGISQLHGVEEVCHELLWLQHACEVREYVSWSTYADQPACLVSSDDTMWFLIEVCSDIISCHCVTVRSVTDLLGFNNCVECFCDDPFVALKELELLAVWDPADDGVLAAKDTELIECRLLLLCASLNDPFRPVAISILAFFTGDWLIHLSSFASITLYCSHHFKSLVVLEQRWNVLLVFWITLDFWERCHNDLVSRLGLRLA